MLNDRGSRAPDVLTAALAIIGVCYALGTRQAWRRLRHHDPPW